MCKIVSISLSLVLTSALQKIRLGEAETILNGSRDISREEAEALSNTFALAAVGNGRVALMYAAAQTRGTIKEGSICYHVETLSLQAKPRFCTKCGAYVGENERHNCDAPHCSECGNRLTIGEAKHGHACKACRAQHIARIYGYHQWREAPIFSKGGKRADVLHMGTEWETCYDGEDLRAAVAEISAVANPDPFSQNLRFMADSTITGVEMITEPKTLSGYVNSSELKAALEKAKELGLHNRDTRDACTGAHIHIDRKFFKDSALAAAAIGKYIATFWDDLILPISERKPSNCRWCNKQDISAAASIVTYSREVQNQSDHCYAFNAANSGTLEFRFWAGTLDWDTIIARFDIVRAIAIWAKKLDYMNVNAMKAWDIFQYIERPETFQYIKKHHPYCQISDEIKAHLPA